LHVGNAYYNCSCVRYVITETSLWLLWLIVGLSVGCAIVLIIIVIIIIVVACRRRRSNAAKERDGNDNDCAGSIELDEDDRNYCTIPAAEADSNANEYCSAGPTEPDNNKEYSVLGPPPTENAPYYLSLQND